MGASSSSAAWQGEESAKSQSSTPTTNITTPSAATLEAREAKGALDEAQARTRLAEQIQAELQSSTNQLELDLKDTQVAFVDLKQQLELEIAETTALNDTVSEMRVNAEDATERELQAYQHVQEVVEMLETARLERDQAQNAKERTATLVTELEDKLVEFSSQAKRELALAIDAAKTGGALRISQQMKELDDLQRQNNELALAVERMAKAKAVAERECEKLARGNGDDDEGIRQVVEQLQHQLTTAHRVSEQHRTRAESLDQRMQAIGKELVQQQDARRHEVAEVERRLLIAKGESCDEQLKANRLQAEVAQLSDTVASTREQLIESARTKEVEVALLDRYAPRPPPPKPATACG
jgi:hypothetical protein